MDRTIECGVLVIGGGLAGCRAALRARDFCDDVLLVDKAVVGRSGASFWGHGILAPFHAGKFTRWMREYVETSEFLTDQECMEILLREQPDRLKDLEEWGVPFKTDSEGRKIEEPGRGGMDYTRLVFFSSALWMGKVKEQVVKKGIRVMKRITITDLLTSDGQHPTRGRVVGAVGFDSWSGEFLSFKAKAVVVTTGMITTKFTSDLSDNDTGDGQAMAFRAGADLTGLEFGPGTSYYVIRDGNFTTGLGLLQFQNHGAFFVNSIGERVMEKYLPGRMERGSGRGPLAQAFVKEILEGRGPLYVDIRHWSPERIELFNRVIPLTMQSIARAGIDVRTERLEFTVLPNGFYSSGDGGIKVGVNGETNLPGLFAAGACSSIRADTEPVGGAPLANCNVFGHRTGEAAGQAASGASEVTVSSSQVEQLKKEAMAPLRQEKGLEPMDLVMAVDSKWLPWRYSIIKGERRIKEALREIQRIENEDVPRLAAADYHGLVRVHEARNLALMAELFQRASLERKESRCKHYREEYPYRDDVDWLCWLVLRRGEKGVEVRKEPLPVERYPIKLDKRERVPAPVQFSYEDYERGLKG
ncbi:MAG: FAD-binding protein [Dehalococcoidia bacterium]|nr:FAD-binding protein [Dehalococcoidia bacterium]